MSYERISSSIIPFDIEDESMPFYLSLIGSISTIEFLSLASSMVWFISESGIVGMPVRSRKEVVIFGFEIKIILSPNSLRVELMPISITSRLPSIILIATFASGPLLLSLLGREAGSRIAFALSSPLANCKEATGGVPWSLTSPVIAYSVFNSSVRHSVSAKLLWFGSLVDNL